MPVLTIVLVVLVAGAVTGALVWLASSGSSPLAGQALADPVSSSPYEGLPPGPVTPGRVRELRFDQVLRGYRMDQVDDVLDRLDAELRSRDEEIDRLRGALGGHGRVDPADHPEVTTGPLAVSEIVRPADSGGLWRRPGAGTAEAGRPGDADAPTRPGDDGATRADRPTR